MQNADYIEPHLTHSDTEAKTAHKGSFRPHNSRINSATICVHS
jgi:hypothetical protein